jgi:hypothetical protein
MIVFSLTACFIFEGTSMRIGFILIQSSVPNPTSSFSNLSILDTTALVVGGGRADNSGQRGVDSQDQPDKEAILDAVTKLDISENRVTGRGLNKKTLSSALAVMVWVLVL